MQCAIEWSSGPIIEWANKFQSNDPVEQAQAQEGLVADTMSWRWKKKGQVCIRAFTAIEEKNWPMLTRGGHRGPAADPMGGLHVAWRGRSLRVRCTGRNWNCGCVWTTAKMLENILHYVVSNAADHVGRRVLYLGNTTHYDHMFMTQENVSKIDR